MRELWFGWDDPLMALAGGGTFGGLAGIDIPEPADLLGKFAAGTEAPPDWSYSYTSGKGLLADRGKVLRHPDGKTIGSFGHPGYRLSDGKLRAGDFDPEGLHKVEEQPMLETWPSAFEALQAGLTASPVEAIDWGTIATGAPIEPAVGAAGDCGCSARIQRARHSSSPPPLDDDMPRRRSAATSPAVRNSPRPTPTPEAASGARPLHPPRQTSDTRSRSIDAAASVSLATRSSPLATRPSPRLSACVRPLEPQLLEPLSILDLDLDSRSAA